MHKSRSAALVLAAFHVIACTTSPGASEKDYTGWKTYAGTKDGIRYSSLEQITPANVAQLRVAWTFSSHDRDSGNRTQNQCNPIVVDGILYGTTPTLKLFALDAATGAPRWTFDPAGEDTAAGKDPSRTFSVSRGVAYWQNADGSDKRIFYSTGALTYAIGAADGKPVRCFGNNGRIDLTEGLDREKDFNPYLAATTPGIVYRNLLIMGGRVAESADAAPGHIRAFDVQTGERKWIFHTIPHPGETGYETWPDKEAYKKLGGANSWAGMALDEARGLLYVPTGSIGGDFYGASRKGTNLFANCLIALDAATGKYRWHFQTVHHDLWDRDLAANPNLVTLHKNGRRIDAVAQITKHGFVFLFDRITGQPVFPIEERPVPQTALPGETPWPTQPFPTLPEPFARQRFTEKDITDISPEAHREMSEKFKTVRHGEMFTPPSKEGSWIFPGFDGGGEWGGAAIDPESGILYVNSTELPWSLTMIDAPQPSGKAGARARGHDVYNRHCLSCHGPDRMGNGSAYPKLKDIGKKYDAGQIRRIIDNGRNMMPSFKQLTDAEKSALLAFLLDKETGNGQSAAMAKEPASVHNPDPYVMTGYNRFLDGNGYPGIKPPWGTLNAVDLNSGKLLWKVALGEFEALRRRGIPPTGTQVYGGPVVTKGGLVFVASTQDEKIRAFDKRTGKVLWEAKLPAAGYATPSVYMVNGKQFVVIACGGGKLGSPSGDQYVAFAL